MDEVIANPMVEIGADLSDLSQKVGEAVGIVEQAGQEMAGAFDGLDLGSVQGLTDGLKGVGDAAGSAVPPLHDAGEATHNAGEAAHEAGGRFEGMGGGISALTESLGKLTAGFVSFEAIKEFATDAIEAAAVTERWETGMRALTGSAEETEKYLGALKDMALQMAVPFDSLLSTFQRLIAKGMEFDQVTTLMQVAQDTAIATGLGFDQVAGALDRIYTTGQLSSRQLGQLGLTWEQLAESMGVSVAEAQNLMKRGSQSAIEDLAAVEEALSKFKGAGAAATQDMQGRWQIFKNAMTEDMDAIGKGLAYLADAWAKVATVVAVATGHLEMMPVAMGKAVAPINEAAHAAQDLGAGFLLAGKNVGETIPGIEKAGDAAGAAAPKFESIYKAIEPLSSKSFIDALVAFQTAVQEAAKFADYAASAVESEGKLAPILVLTASEQKAATDAATEGDRALARILATAAQLPAQFDATGHAMQTTAEAAKQLNREYQEFGVTVRGADIERTLADFNDLLKRANLSTDDLNIAWASLGNKFRTSVDYQQQVLDKMIAAGRPVQDILAKEQQILDLQMKQAEAVDMTGQSELALAQKMTAVEAQQFILHQQTMGLADDWNNAIRAFTTAWSAVPKAFADAIVSGQDFGQATKKILLDLADQILTGIFKQAMDDMGAQILKNMGFLNTFSEKITATVGKGGAFQTAMDDSGNAVQGFASKAKTSMQDASTAIHTTSSAMVADLNLVATAIGAIASIFAAIELAHTNTLLARIEESTRRLDITTEGILVQAAQTTIDFLPKLDNIWSSTNELTNVVNLLGTINQDTAAMLRVLDTIAVGGIGGGGGGGGGTGGDAFLTMLNNGLATIAGLLGGVMNAVVVAGGGSPVYTSSGGGYSPVIVSVPGSGSSSVPGIAAAGAASASADKGPSVTVNVQAGVVAGNNGMQQLAGMVTDKVVSSLKGTVGLKI